MLLIGAVNQNPPSSILRKQPECASKEHRFQHRNRILNIRVIIIKVFEITHIIIYRHPDVIFNALIVIVFITSQVLLIRMVTRVIGLL